VALRLEGEFRIPDREDAGLALVVLGIDLAEVGKAPLAETRVVEDHPNKIARLVADRSLVSRRELDVLGAAGTGE
jgi:hypothetical protein